MGIMKKCGGLPLAIKVTGGLLSRRYPSEHEWKSVLNDPGWSIAGLPEELDKRLYLSYQDLSPQLKQCFLYCSLFPKGKTFPREVVIGMWISDGFIQPPDGSSFHDQLEEVATEYHRELMMRNLIEPSAETCHTGDHCTMHDVVRSFAEYMAREESLVVRDNHAIASINSDSLVRRLSIGPTVPVEEWAILQKQELLRTLIINSRIKFKPGDSLRSFSSLRVLYIKSGIDSDRLVDSLWQAKHLRYLHLDDTDISRLPNDIDKMKFLQHIVLVICKKLSHLPASIIKLAHLRTLDITSSSVGVVPKGFGGLTNLRRLFGFPVHMDMEGGWCSLEEIAPLSELRRLMLDGLENVSPSSLAEKAMVYSKGNLNYMELNCNGRRLMELGDGEVEQRQQTIEEVFDKLYPPTCLETLRMKGGYFGRRLPIWMMTPGTMVFRSWRHIRLEELTCCTELPDGLCRLPSLETLVILGAPAIKRVGPKFQAGEAASAAFPKLRFLKLDGLRAWEEWEWEKGEEEVTADTIPMPALDTLDIRNCKLAHLPPGLANSMRHALRKLNLYHLTNITSVENFPSVVDLHMVNCPSLKRISGLSMLQKIVMEGCPNVEALEGVPSLDTMELKDDTMETLPWYLATVNPRYLAVECSKKMYGSFLEGNSDWDKISHIRTRAIDHYPKNDD